MDFRVSNQRVGKITTPYAAYYTHSHTSVVVDSLQAVANITRVQPQKTQKYVNESKISSSSKKGSTFSAAGLVSAILPQLTFGGNASRIAEQTTSSDKTQKSARIRQTAIRGVARWGFYNADDFDQDGGKVVSSDELPSAHFNFIGWTDTPAPPPERIDIEVSTFYSLYPRSDTEATARASFEFSDLFKLGRRPSYLNFSKRITLNLPSALRSKHYYTTHLSVPEIT